DPAGRYRRDPVGDGGPPAAPLAALPAGRRRSSPPPQGRRRAARRRPARVDRRMSAVSRLLETRAERDSARKHLGEIADLERLVGRAQLGVATPRDLVTLGRSLALLPALAEALRAAWQGEIGGALAGAQAGTAEAGGQGADDLGQLLVAAA